MIEKEISPDAKTFLDIVDRRAADFFNPFVERMLPGLMSGVALAYQLDGQSETADVDVKLAWLKEQAQVNNFIFLQILVYIMGLLPEELKGKNE